MGHFFDSGQKLGQSEFVNVGDLDNDEDLDAITCSEVWLNKGNGTYSIVSLNNQAWGCSGIWLGDADGDRDLDAFVGRYEGINELWSNTTNK